MDSNELRELAEKFRQRGFSATALLLEADAWTVEHPNDAFWIDQLREKEAAA